MKIYVNGQEITYIRAYARSRSVIRAKLAEHMDETYMHMLCLMLSGEPDLFSHWRTDIYSFLSSVRKLQGKNKYPDATEIYNWTYGEERDCISDPAFFHRLLDDVVTKEESVKVTQPESEIAKELDRVCVEYFTWIAKELSQYGRVTNTQVHTALKQIIPR